MNANPKFLSATAHVDEAAVKPLPSSRKVYVAGSRPDIQVPMREITQSDTPASFGAEKNAPIFVYDTSGSYTDPAVKIDIRSGLAPLRLQWIAERNDTVELDGPSSLYGRERLADGKLASLRFSLARKPRRARPGMNVTQMHYARRGMVTPEMEYIAIRENQRRENSPSCSPGSIVASISAPRSRTSSPRNSYATKWREGAPSSRSTSTIPNPSRW